jgi:hypothetical protein
VWLVTLLDFVERATGRTTSLREHVTMFVIYVLMIVLIPVGMAAFVVVEIVALGTWPGMTSIGILAASAGGAVFVRRLRSAGGLPAVDVPPADPAVGVPLSSEAKSIVDPRRQPGGMNPDRSDSSHEVS